MTMTEAPAPSRPWFSPWYGAAWACYAISMFLPAIPNGNGWQCAKASLEVLLDSWKGNKEWLVYGSYSLPNFFMVLSPILFPLFRSRSFNVVWLACATAFSVHVFSFLVLTAGGDEWPGSGYFLWLTSFVCLAVGTFELRRQHLGFQREE